MVITLDEGFIKAGFTMPQHGWGLKSDTVPVKNNHSNHSKRVIINTAATALAGGGALLLYLGCKNPSVTKSIKKLYNEKSVEFMRSVANFREETQRIFTEHYKNIEPYIEYIRTEKIFNPNPARLKIPETKNSTEVLDILDTSFAQIRKARQKRLSPQLSDMDEARQAVYGTNYYAYRDAEQNKTKTAADMITKSLMPRFKDGKHKELLTRYEEELAEMVSTAKEKMSKIQTQTSDEFRQTYCSTISAMISRFRKNNLNSAQTIMKDSFKRIGRMLGCDETFRPLFITGKTSKNFNALALNDLRPEKLSELPDKIITEPYVKYLLENIDFKELSGNTLKKIFYGMPENFDIKKLDLVTDRIRLQQAVELTRKEKENHELKILAGKLEYLSLKLEEYGKTELLSKCDRNFTGITDEALKAKLYYVHKAAMRLGLYDLDDVDLFLTKNVSGYANTNVKQAVKKARSNPELFYM